MRINLAILVLIQLLWLNFGIAAPPQAKETRRGSATVSGQVVLNGSPLSDVTVVLRPERPTTSEEAKGFEAKTDDDGNYRITGVTAGHFLINISSPGFLMAGVAGASMRGKMLTIAAGEKLENINFEVKREGVITGRVTDSNGNPVSREWIELIKLGDDGKPQPSPFNHPGPRITDERGVYRITGLPDGQYLVSVGVSPDENATGPQYRTSDFPRTFHPGVSDLSQAVPVRVAIGNETTAVNISGVVAKKAYEISGRVVYAETGEPAPGIAIQYGAMSKDRGVISGWRPNKERSTTEGEFQIQGVSAGKYAIYAHTFPKRELFSDPVVCEIKDGGIQGVELRLHRGGSISGAVVIEGSNDPAVLARLSQLQVIGLQRLGNPAVPYRDPTGLNADGSFHIQGLQSGKVMISIYVNPNSGGFRMKRVERDGVPQPDGLEIAPGENLSNVRVIVEYGNLTLRGEVKIIGGKLPPSHWVIANATRLNESPPRPCAANVDTRGKFIFENLLPGEYEVRLVSLRYQPGEPLDKGLLNLISGVKQKVSIDSPNHAPITLVVDLSRKESGQ